MKKDLGVKDYLFPMPVAMIATYGPDGKVDVMNMAWGTLCDSNMVLCNLTESHKTVKNMKAGSDFTISLATKPLMAASDYFGMASGNVVQDKFERSGLHAVPSKHVKAPVIEEYPLTLECRFHKDYCDDEGNYMVYGEIVNVLADETILNADGSFNFEAWKPILFSSLDATYYEIGPKAGKAFSVGKEYLTKKH